MSCAYHFLMFVSLGPFTEWINEPTNLPDGDGAPPPHLIQSLTHFLSLTSFCIFMSAKPEHLYVWVPEKWKARKQNKKKTKVLRVRERTAQWLESFLTESLCPGVTLLHKVHRRRKTVVTSQARTKVNAKHSIYSDAYIWCNRRLVCVGDPNRDLILSSKKEASGDLYQKNIEYKSLDFSPINLITWISCFFLENQSPCYTVEQKWKKTVNHLLFLDYNLLSNSWLWCGSYHPCRLKVPFVSKHQPKIKSGKFNLKDSTKLKYQTWFA